MARFRTSAQNAWRLLREQNYSLWTAPRIDPNDIDGPFAVQRMKQPFFRPYVNTTVEIGWDSQMFAIGSCFARGIENALVDQGLDLASADSVFETPEFNPDGITGRGFINKYTTHAILNDLRWALDPDETFPESSYIDAGDGTWQDPHFSHRIRAVDYETTLWRRGELTRVSKKVATSEVVFITLGLVETWFDRETGHYLNWMPDPARNPSLDLSRFRFETSDFRQNWNNLEEVHALLTKFGDPSLQIIVTVSPVPLSGTFTGKDVVEANTYSKSLLRTCATEWAAEHDNVHYFPSFEMVMNSDRSLAWQEDGRHVDPTLVYQITQRFMVSYFDKHSQSGGSKLTRKAKYVQDRIRARSIGSFIQDHRPERTRLALDLACGTGATTMLLDRETRADQTIGYTAEQENLPRLSRFVEFRVHDALETPLPDGPADAMLVPIVLLVQGDPSSNLAAWAESLTEEGRLYMFVVSEIASDDPVFAQAIEVLRAASPHPPPPSDLPLFVKEAGLEVIAHERIEFEVSPVESFFLYRRSLGGMSDAILAKELLTQSELTALIESIHENDERQPVRYTVDRLAVGKAAPSTVTSP